MTLFGGVKVLYFGKTEKFMAKTAKKNIKTEPKEIENPDLFSRVEFIIEKAHDNVLRAVNTNMVIAYWLIGREIVNEIQQGKERAVYGKSVIDKLSELLTLRYKRGYSKASLRDYRQFYQVYSNRVPSIHHIGCGEFERTEIGHIECDKLNDPPILHTQCGESKKGFSPNLGWSHYRALMRVDNENERLFYEIEAEKERWDVKHLERQIHTFLYARLMKSKNKAGVIELASKGNKIEKPTDIFKSSMDNTIVKYSVLKGNEQLFASKYRLILPTEDELKREIEREILMVREEMAKYGRDYE